LHIMVENKIPKKGDREEGSYKDEKSIPLIF